MATLKGKTALVTGGCGGLGQAISNAFLKAGANVVACDINTTLIKSFIKTCGPASSYRLLAFECDISREDSIVKLFHDAIDRFGQVDIVVNNAGIMDKMDPVGDLDKALWDRVIAINLTAPFMVSKVAVAHMLEKQIKGSIINVASVAGVRGFAAGKTNDWIVMVVSI